MLSQHVAMKPLTLVSVEGFWEKDIHDARVREAAEKLHELPQAFAIATATHAPANCQSFTKQPLGQYTAQKLIADYQIAPYRILPAYLFPQKTTYTIIDALSNAMMIGWLCTGLKVSPKIICTSLYPVSAGFRVQQERILLLNTRSTKALEKLSIQVTIHLPVKTMSFEQVTLENPEEAQKLAALKKSDSVIHTGTWKGNSGILRSFDDIAMMKNEITQAFSKTFNDFDCHDLFELSDLERLLLTMIWNTKANANIINYDEIYKAISSYFTSITNYDIQAARDNLVNNLKFKKL